MKKKGNIYWRLLSTTALLSVLTFGGGYVIIALMRKKFVDHYNFIKDNEMLDIVTISQCSPGAISINASVLVGYKIAGIRGAIITVLGTLIPPVAIMTLISIFYSFFNENILVKGFLSGMQACVAAIIFDVVISMGSSLIKSDRMYNILIMILTFIAVFFFKINVIIIIIVCGILGVLLPLIRQKKGGKDK